MDAFRFFILIIMGVRMYHNNNDYKGMKGRDYNHIYARYVKRNLDKLILSSGDITGKRVLDLCAGSGVVALRAKELGASYVMVYDQSETMVRELLGRDEIDAVTIKQEGTCIPYPSALKYCFFDVIICRQAVNYWWCENGVREVLTALKPGGFFIFNTFHGNIWTDPHYPSTGTYEINGVHYSETHYLIDDVIHHVQCCEGHPPHCTTFQYIKPSDFLEVISIYDPFIFGWSVERFGNTDIYVIQRGFHEKCENERVSGNK